MSSTSAGAAASSTPTAGTPRFPDLPAMFEESHRLGFHIGLHNNKGTPEAEMETSPTQQSPRPGGRLIGQMSSSRATAIGSGRTNSTSRATTSWPIVPRKSSTSAGSRPPPSSARCSSTRRLCESPLRHDLVQGYPEHHRRNERANLRLPRPRPLRLPMVVERSWRLLFQTR